MPDFKLAHSAVAFGAAFVAGAINSVAGGGSLISFPAAVAAGLPPIVANASNTVAMAPASLASAWAYRRELAGERPVVRLLLVPAALGGAAGAALLLVTPAAVFAASVPALILLATLLLLVQNIRGPRSDDTEALTASAPAPPLERTGRAVVLQFFVAVYGGYFGAGMGIMMLALLALLGRTDIHKMNGVKIFLGAAINGVAALGFLVARAIDPTATVVMTLGGVLGGFTGAAVARRVNKAVVRWTVVAIGFGMAVLLAYRRWAAP